MFCYFLKIFLRMIQADTSFILPQTTGLRETESQNKKVVLQENQTKEEKKGANLLEQN